MLAALFWGHLMFAVCGTLLRRRPKHMLRCLQAFAERVLKGKADKAPFKSSVENFYQTDAISRSSQVMAKCVVARQKMPTRFQKYA